MKKFLLKNKNILPYSIYFFINLIINIVSFAFFGDDTRVAENLASCFTLNFMGGFTWSSRIIVNTICGVAQYVSVNISPYIYLIINSLMYTLLTCSLSGIASKILKCDFLKTSWIAFGVVLTFPIVIMSSAGWIATSTSYMWPSAAAAFFWNQYINIKNTKANLFVRILAIAALLYSVNLEGYSVLFTVIFFSIIILQAWEKTLKSRTMIYGAICVISVLSHLLSPGNSARADAEVVAWFSNFKMLGFIDRFELTMSRLTYQLIFDFNVVFILFAIVLCIATHYATSDRFYRNISIIPLGFSVGFPLLQRVSLYTGITYISSQMQTDGSIRVDNYDSISAYIITSIGQLVVISIIVSLFVIFIDINLQTAVCSIFAFIGGIGSYFIMIFSPTIWASGDRPIMPMYLIIMGLTIFVAVRTITVNSKSVTLLEKTITSACVLTILNEIAIY